MGPFLQFRLWSREGPAGERVVAAIAAVAFIGLVALAAVPVRHGADDETAIVGGDGAPAATVAGTTTSGGPAAGDASTTTDDAGTTADAATATTGGGTAGGAGATTGGTAPTSTTGGATSGGSSNGATATPAGTASGQRAAASCAGRRASAPGISANEVRVNLSRVDLAGPVANEAFGIRRDIDDIARAVVDEINETGGIACGRKLVARIYTVNPIDSGDQQRKCLQMVQERPFAVIDLAGYARPGPRACFVQNKQLFQNTTLMSADEVAKSGGYLYGPSATVHESVRNALLRLNDMGWFAAPRFKKLGLFLEACDPTLNAEIDRVLSSIGVNADRISRFTTECQLIGSPSQISAGVLKHKTDGATHVFLASSLSNSQNYTRRANEQDYRPMYGGSDQGSLATSSSAPNWQGSFHGGIIVTTTRSGGLTSGVPSEAAERCSKILAEHGLRGVEDEVEDSTAYGWCDQLFFFRQAIAKAGVNPTRTSFLQGLGTMGRFESANAGDGDFNRPGKVTGGDFHRPIQWRSDCTCYRVIGGFEPNQ